MKSQTKITMMILVCGMLLLCCGCSNSDKKKLFEYNNPQKSSGLTLYKTVYSKDRIELYSPTLNGKYELTCFDKNFKAIQGAFYHSYKDGVYTIRFENPEKISGIRLSNNQAEFNIRYLDSNQYAAICYFDATDVGWMTDDDGEDYYTEEEKQKRKAEIEARQELQKNNFETLLGEWVLIGDEKTTLNFYYDNDDNRKCAWTRADGDGGYHTDEIKVDNIDIIEHRDQIMLNIMEGVGWGCCFSFSISEDMSMIKEQDLEWNRFYVHKNSEMTDYEFTMLKTEMRFAEVLVDDEQVAECLKQLEQAGAKQFESAKWDYKDDQYIIKVLTEDQTVYGVFLTNEGDVVKAEEIPEQ